ncbi:putative heat shock protein GrpE [marine gamma proteobacterium HTCC2143]|jgi:molecular chaperone GrpE|uniref:Protein GrpE n=1 Tax=marine gamma proteobacterium HTCC2143 TaxID=247633 RepID=A0YHG5_9GAMM|nr:putative heat shock protein GrpE [marine gamma proteobacterium HTCC2143]
MENTVSDQEKTNVENDQQAEHSLTDIHEVVDGTVEDSEVSESPESEDQILSPEAQIEALEDELAKTRDDALRTLAEAQNIRRRSEKDIENARKFALEKFASELLGVADNLERALDSADKDNEVVKVLLEGVALTQKSLVDTLAKFNIMQLDPLGEPFDPQFHQAMSMVENPDVEPNTVTLVMQKGYVLNERLLRPAMVMVSKAVAPSIDEQV